MRKQYSEQEMLVRNYCQNRRKLLKACKDLGLNLFSDEDVEEHDLMTTYICVLSIKEYNIGCTYMKCDKTDKIQYFLSPHDYEVYTDFIGE